MQPLDHGLQERRGQELERVPDQSAIELFLGKAQCCVQEMPDFQRVGLVLVKVAVAEAFVKLMDEVVGIEPMAVVGEETYRGLTRARQVQNGQARALIERCAELIETVAVPGPECTGIGDCRSSAYGHRLRPP